MDLAAPFCRRGLETPRNSHHYLPTVVSSPPHSATVGEKVPDRCGG
jgi:hypothetical protein